MKKGFAIVEFICVIAIIGILYLMLLPAIVNFKNGKSLRNVERYYSFAGRLANSDDLPNADLTLEKTDVSECTQSNQFIIYTYKDNIMKIEFQRPYRKLSIDNNLIIMEF